MAIRHARLTSSCSSLPLYRTMSSDATSTYTSSLMGPPPLYGDDGTATQSAMRNMSQDVMESPTQEDLLLLFSDATTVVFEYEEPSAGRTTKKLSYLTAPVAGKLNGEWVVAGYDSTDSLDRGPPVTAKAATVFGWTLRLSTAEAAAEVPDGAKGRSFKRTDAAATSLLTALPAVEALPDDTDVVLVARPNSHLGTTGRPGGLRPTTTF